MEEYDKLDRYIERCDYYLPFAWSGAKRKDRNNHKMNEKSYCCIFDSVKCLVEKCGCSKVIIPGTFSEYKNSYVSIDETTSCEPELEYGKYKYQLYKDLLIFCQLCGVAFVEGRMFSVYGSDDYEDKMLNSILKKMLKNEEIFLTNAVHIWDFIHVDDVAEAFLQLMESEVENGCYNIATMEHRTLKSYLEEMKKLTGSTSRLVYGAIPYQGTQIPHVICDTQKIQHIINWKPKITFEEGIKDCIRCYRREG